MCTAEPSELTRLLQSLGLTEILTPLTEELEALLAIYGPGSVQVLERPASNVKQKRYIEVKTSLPQHADVELILTVTLPLLYPESGDKPQLQVKNAYLGDVAVDHTLFGDVVRVFMGYATHQAGDSVLFDGIEQARELAGQWYDAKSTQQIRKPGDHVSSVEYAETTYDSGDRASISESEGSYDGSIAVSEPIIDRKSVFVGRAAPLKRVEHVSAILAHVKSDKRVARATHNIVAWRCRTPDGVLHQDNDDDGESAAGARLAHLLDIIKVENVIVVVSRWYGGIHLGADRFKHINAAARAALLAGAHISSDYAKKSPTRQS